jgi:hypothetical protein
MNKPNDSSTVNAAQAAKASEQEKPKTISAQEYRKLHGMKSKSVIGRTLIEFMREGSY